MAKFQTKPSTMIKVITRHPRPKSAGPTVAVSGSGAASMKDATVRMKKVTGGGSVLQALGEAGEDTRLATLQALEATDHTHHREGSTRIPSVSLLIEKEAIAEVAAGASPKHVEVKYDLTRGYVDHALKRRYGSPEAAKLALQGLVSENALACMVKAAIEIPNMSGPQAVMSGAILIDKALALEKSIADRPRTIDFGALADMGKTLKVLREIAAGAPLSSNQ